LIYTPEDSPQNARRVWDTYKAPLPSATDELDHRQRDGTRARIWYVGIGIDIGRGRGGGIGICICICIGIGIHVDIGMGIGTGIGIMCVCALYGKRLVHIKPFVYLYICISVIYMIGMNVCVLGVLSWSLL